MKQLFLALSFLLTLPAARAEIVWWPQPEQAFRFGERYPEAQKLLFAFDYAHALVYESLLRDPEGALRDRRKFEADKLALVMKILKNPPTTKVNEEDIGPNYVFTFPLTVQMFDWSHLLHQFVYDIFSVEKVDSLKFQKSMAEVIRQYHSKPQIAISTGCKSMLFMDGQRVSKDGLRALAQDSREEGFLYSKSFRRAFPSFNQLIWVYHWFQIRLYEDLLDTTRARQDAAVAKTVAEFWKLIADLPDSADFDMMPESKKVAPKFFKKFPELAMSFDNNHMMHDIISDILVSPLVKDKRAVGLATARMNLDPEAFKSTECQ